MPLFRDPEQASVYGVLAASNAADGAPVSAHELRVCARNGNLEKGRSDVLTRFHGDARTASDGLGSTLSFAPPYWQHALLTPLRRVQKKPGVREMRVWIRAVISADQTVLWYVGSTLAPSPRGQNLASSAVIPMVGTGVEQVVTATIPVREGPDEVLTLYMKALVDPDNDPVMDTATYGSPQTGNVSRFNGLSILSYPGATWAGVDAGGHYLFFRAPSATNFQHVPAQIVGNPSATELIFSPSFADDIQRGRAAGARFDLYQLPGVRLVSFAAAGADRSP